MISLLTRGILLLTTAILIIWDIYAAIAGERGATISEVVYSTSVNWLALAFCSGGLMGHFFVPRKQMPSPAIYWSCFAGLLSIAGLLFLLPSLANTLFFSTPTVALFAGIGLGAALWPQKRIAK